MYSTPYSRDRELCMYVELSLSRERENTTDTQETDGVSVSRMFVHTEYYMSGHVNQELFSIFNDVQT
jgi:hypothetical protein